MFQKIKHYLVNHEKQYELLRYLIAGGLTTLLSMLIHYAVCFLLADKPPFSGNLLPWLIGSINLATPMQLSIASAISWVIAVLFAFWINRVMVFRVQGGKNLQIGKELAQFAASRAISFFVFEQGLMLLLKAVGVSNFVNRIIVLVFVMIFNYVVSKFWIFKK
ncbi:MAG: GtrA family protein [Clostridia bacterium]